MTVDIEIRDLILGLLIFIRLSGIIFLLPFFGDSPVPAQVKVLTSASLAFFLFPILRNQLDGVIINDLMSLVLLVAKELMIGISLGLMSRMFFDGIVMAASIVGYQMGFGTANMILPGSDAQMNSFTALHRLIVVMIFFSLNYHLMYIEAAYQSFTIIPTGSFSLNPAWIERIIASTSDIFLIAIRMAAPVLVALMFAMAALGLIARAVPQMNVFTMSFPLSFFVGLMTYMATLPFLPAWLRDHYVKEGESMIEILMMMR